jgi:hypothetical protein
MSHTGAEVSTRPTILGRLGGVQRSCFTPRGTLNSSKSLVVRFNGFHRTADVRDGIVLKCWVP